MKSEEQTLFWIYWVFNSSYTENLMMMFAQLTTLWTEIAAITSIVVLIQLNKDVVVQIFPWFRKFQINLTLIFCYLQSITVTFSTIKIELQYH